MYSYLFEEKKQEEMRSFFIELEKKGHVKKYIKKECIYIDGYSHIGVVVSGSIKQIISNPKGEEKSLFILSPGEIFGEMDYFTSSKCDLFLKAIENSNISIISREQIQDELGKNPIIYEYFIHSIVRKYRISLFQMRDIVFNKSITRLGEAILRMAYQSGIKEGGKTVINGIFTHQEIADLIGCSRITVTNDINELKKHSLLDIKNKKIIINDVEKLREFINVER